MSFSNDSFQRSTLSSSFQHSKRVDGKFLSHGNSSVPAGQAILVGLLEENFEICHDVAARQDDVPPPLKPIYDRLSDLRGQLERLLLTHRWTLRETDLWNYSQALQEIDKMRLVWFPLTQQYVS